MAAPKLFVLKLFCIAWFLKLLIYQKVVMNRILKPTPKKTSFSNKVKHRGNFTVKPAEKKYILQHFLHPDYILFDWEFFSRELEFE